MHYYTRWAALKDPNVDVRCPGPGTTGSDIDMWVPTRGLDFL
jgi:hypothetical protein